MTSFFNDIILRHPKFDALSEQKKMLFLFNNIDPYMCKKLGYFIFWGFSEEETKNVIVFQYYKLL